MCDPFPDPARTHQTGRSNAGNRRQYTMMSTQPGSSATAREHNSADEAADDLELPPASAGNAKLQRWVDLVAALLARRKEVTFEQLAPEVPAYEWPDVAGTNDPTQLAEIKRRRDSTKRMFERDKDELRALGIPIETVADHDDNEEGAYRLRRTDFYLPYLVLVAPEASTQTVTQQTLGSTAERARAIAGYGYAALATLAFEPDELQAIVDAAACARELGDPMLAAEASRALRKLAFDLPVGPTGSEQQQGAVHVSSGVPRVQHDAAQHDAAVFAALADAMQRRKRVRFEYHTFGRNEVRERAVEPWGLFFQSGHWYLVARDVDAAALRNFRLNRIRVPQLNTKQAQTPDFDVPSDFRLREHAASRQAWELGEDPPLEVIVRFRADDDAARAALQLGETLPPAADGTERRRFSVRREDAFIRWLLALAGDAIPESPTSLVDGVRHALERLATSVETGAAQAAALGTQAPALAPVLTKPAARVARVTETAAAQLRRILQTMPLLASGDSHAIQDLVQRTGIDADTLRSDVFALVARYDTPGGFVEGVQLFIDRETISAVTTAFRRPMRLVATEVCAITLGLSVLKHLRTPNEHAVLERARARLERVVVAIGNDPIVDRFAVSAGDVGNLATLATVRLALQQRQVLTIHYHKSSANVAETREVEPYAILASGACLYMVAHCRRAQQLRLFRLDRVLEAQKTGEQYVIPDGFSIDAVVQRGRAFMNGVHAALVVRYSPTIARWIAEREGVALADDGSLTVSHPLADTEWAVRHVFQYCGDAEVIAPATMHVALRERIHRLRSALNM